MTPTITWPTDKMDKDKVDKEKVDKDNGGVSSSISRTFLAQFGLVINSNKILL